METTERSVAASRSDDSAVERVPALPGLAAQARSYAEESKAESTRRCYHNDWQRFTTWCAARDLSVLPAAPETIALYLTEAASTCKPSTLSRRLASISVGHQAHGHASPTAHPPAR